MVSPSTENLQPTVYLISNAQEWRDVEQHFRQSIVPIHAIGLDCEWVEPENFAQKDARDYSQKYYDDRVDFVRRLNAANGKVSLLQMASHDGTTVLIRLCLFDEIPPSLKELLENGNIVKLGVNIELDVKKLFTTWGILLAGFVDVRNVFGQNRRFMEEYNKDGLGLKRLGAFFTNDATAAEDEQLKTIRYSNWAARRLTHPQIEYASKDARMAVQSLISFAFNYVDGIPQDKLHPEFWPLLYARLQNHIGRPCDEYLVNYGKIEPNSEEDEDPSPTSSKNTTSKRKPGEIFDTSSSDVELDFVGWQKTKDYKQIEKITGAERAVLFYATDGHGNSGPPVAAIDSAFLTAMEEAGEKKAVLRFKVKNGSKEDSHSHDVKVTLRRISHK